MLGDGVAVTRSRQQRAQDQEIEGAAKELDARRWLLSHPVGSLLIIV
jgi:hypothetical protein